MTQVPIKKEELDDLPERFTRLYSPVREAKPSTDAVATPDGSAADGTFAPHACR